MTFKTQKLKAILEIRTGLSLRKAAKEDPNGDAFLVQMKDVNPQEGLNLENAIKIDTKGYRNPSWLKKDDILFIGRGARFFAIHLKEMKNKCVASPHFYVLRNKKHNRILPEFLVWYLNSKTAKKFYAANQEGSSLPYISRKTLDALPIQLPDIEAQAKIVNAYRCWHKQRLLLKELTEKKEAYINAQLEQALKGELI